MSFVIQILGPEDRLPDRIVSDRLFHDRIRVQFAPECNVIRLVEREAGEQQRRLADGPFLEIRKCGDRRVGSSMNQLGGVVGVLCCLATR